MAASGGALASSDGVAPRRERLAGEGPDHGVVGHTGGAQVYFLIGSEGLAEHVRLAMWRVEVPLGPNMRRLGLLDVRAARLPAPLA